MEEFKKRTKAPDETNKYYIKTTYKGYNKCILIDYLTGSVLPNCTGYSWGRTVLWNVKLMYILAIYQEEMLKLGTEILQMVISEVKLLN